MAALIMVRPGADWQVTGGLFDWTLEYLIVRLTDPSAAAELRTIVDNNLGSLWIPDLPEKVQQEIYALLADGLVDAAERELPEGPGKASAVDRLRELAAMARGS
jgi:hypothetical protein